MILFFALLVGMFSVLPPFLIWRDLVNQGETFLLMQQNVYRDEFFQYMPRAREVFEGHFPPAGVYANEIGPSPLNPLPPLVFSLFLRMFKGEVNPAYLTAQFLFTSSIFLLFFTLGFVLFRSRALALFFSLVGTLTQIPQLLFRYYDRDYLGITLKKFIPIVRTPLDKMYFARMDDPLLTFPVLLTALIMLYLFWMRPTKYRAIWAGLFSGLLVYTYLHYWLFVAVFVGLLFLCARYFYKGDKTRFEGCLTLGLIVFLVLIPYLVNYFNFSSASYSDDYALRLGKEIDRFLVVKHVKEPAGWTFIVNNLAYLVTVVLVYLFYFRGGKRTALGVFFLGLTLTMFLVWHIPLVTGFGFSITHFNKPISLAIFIVLFGVGQEILKKVNQKRPELKKIAGWLGIVLAMLLLTKHVVNATVFLQPPAEQLKAYSFPKDIVSSWHWLNSNVKDEPRFVSDSLVTSLYLVSYTSVRPYLATGFLSTLTDTELEDRFYVSNKLFNVPGGMLSQRFKGPPPYNCEVRSCFKDTWLNMDFGKTRWYLTSANWSRTAFETKTQETLRKYKDMLVVWSQTGADFVYYGPWEKQFGLTDLSLDPNLELVYQNDRVEIFKIKHDIL